MNKDYWETILKAVEYHSLTGEMPEGIAMKELPQEHSKDMFDLELFN